MTTENERAKDQARAQFESIKEMVAALNCDWDRLEELKKKQEAYDAWENETPGPLAEDDLKEWEEARPDALDAAEEEELKELEEAAGDCSDYEQAERRIQEDPLSVQVRSDWHYPGSEGNEATEFQILLCTGGPAVKIEGTLDHGEPDSAEIYYQDWFTSWEELGLTSEEEEIVLDYCRCFYFGE